MNSSLWEQIGGELDALVTTSGGRHKLHKPVVRIEVYEHDDEVTVEVDRCKGSGGVVIRKGALGAESYPSALLRLLKEARAEAEKTA